MRIKDAIDKFPSYRGVLVSVQSKFHVDVINDEIVVLMINSAKTGRVFFELTNGLGTPSTHCSSVYSRGTKIGGLRHS